jgi:hypothetical protein
MNTHVYAEDWAVKLQERLSEKTKWKEVSKVEYTDSKTLNNPYSTDPTVQSGTRGAAYTHQAITQTNESISIDTFKILPQLIDRADLAQSKYSNQMDLADVQGVLLNESIETAMMASYTQMTDFGLVSPGVYGLSSSAITVDASNIDDIIRNIKTQIRKANGESLMERNGAFIIWRADDFELLEAYAQANGYITSDAALKDGLPQGFKYMGVYHYSSNKGTAGHLIAGVRGLLHVGICKSTYGQVVIDNEPATADGAVSGVGIVSRVDFKFKVWTKVAPVLFDINVA